MGRNDAPHPGVHPTNGQSRARNTMAAEALLISQATSTAMVAARSILMSGGSEQVALKTAKAAAESVLRPTGSELETLSVRSTTFLRRRKAKRQAEVVASMALMSAASSVRAGVSTEWDTITASTDQNRSLTNPFARHITTKSMLTADEPSVLSSSTRAPRVQTPRSLQSRPKEMTYAPIEENSTPATSGSVLSSLPPASDGTSNKKTSSTGSVATASTIMGILQAPPSLLSQASPPPPDFPSKQTVQMGSEASQNAESTKMNVASRNLFSGDSEDLNSVNPSETMESLERHSSLENETDLTGGDTFDDETIVNEKKNEFVWKKMDPFLVSFTNAFNMMTCNPLGTILPGSDSETHSSKSPGQHYKKTKSPGRRRNTDDDEETEVDDFNGETFDETEILSDGEVTDLEDRDDNGTEIHDMHSEDSTDSIQDRFLSESASSHSSVDSSQLLRELHSSSSSEGEIQVRSSIRETMERIVSKSKRNVQEDSGIDKTWLSYELRQDEDPEIMRSVMKAKGESPLKNGKKNFFFRKKSSRKSS